MPARAEKRLPVLKTYKLYIGGELTRTESGRFYPVHAPGGGALLANACRGSRKDLRNAVVAAGRALPGWSGRTAANRGQIVYRMAEMCEGRAGELVGELKRRGTSARDARREVEGVVDRLVYYAGWADKVGQVFGTVNPVAGPYYNFSVVEPMGIVGVVAPEEPPLLGLVSRLLPVIVSGNTAVALASEASPLPAVTFAEILATSDLPGGVVNILTGWKRELVPWLASHMDVRAIDLTGVPTELRAATEAAAADNVKRAVPAYDLDWADEAAQSPYMIADFLETKTVWHPMGM
jgi:acyl-CoA reductase-like NAD-dependent aldehyde dehydrogenase